MRKHKTHLCPYISFQIWAYTKIYAYENLLLENLTQISGQKCTKFPKLFHNISLNFHFSVARKAREISKRLLVCFADFLGLDKPLNFWMFIQAKLEVYPYLIDVLLHKKGHKIWIYWPLVFHISICKMVSVEWLQLTNVSTGTYVGHLGKMTRANEKIICDYLWHLDVNATATDG